MIGRIAEYLRDPDLGRRRRTILLTVGMTAAVVGIALIAFARQKPSAIAPQRLLANPGTAAPLAVAPRSYVPTLPQSTLPYLPTLPQPTLTQVLPQTNLWPQGGASPQTAYVAQRVGASNVCVCPNCGARVPHDGHLYCPNVPCPHCGRAMLPGVPVGGNQLTGSPPPLPRPNSPTTQAFAGAAIGGTFAAATAPSYDATVAPIVSKNCLRCHGGPMRNLSTYQNLKQYAASGLLAMMIQPGGPMSHFLTPAEAQVITDWIAAGEPR